MESIFVLIHSPLVGPLTWSLLAEELRQRGVATVVPTLVDDDIGAVPFWRQHAEAVARRVEQEPGDCLLVLVGHSGAGPLLPAIRQAAARPAAAYVFVDAGFPVAGKSRLDLMASEDPEFARPLRQHLASGERFPSWSEEDLREVIPDPRLRRGMLKELRPRPLAFFEEPIPVFAGWPDAPCGYLRFSPAYEAPAEHARRLGWAYREITAGHFHMLVDPSTVATTLTDMVGRLQQR